MDKRSQKASVRSVDAVIIGSGLAGLTTGAALAAAGRRAVVLEQYSVVGGTTHVFRRKGKWEWQVGVHHLADCGFGGDMPTMLRGLGIGRDQLSFRRMDDTGYERIVFPDLTFETPTDWGLYEQRLIDAFPDQRRQISTLLRAARHIGRAIDRGPSMSGVGGFARSALAMGPYASIALLPLKRVLDLFGISSQLQALMTVSPCGSLNCPPSRLPFAAFGAYYRLFIEGGSWFPEGGGQMLAASLLATLEQHGGEAITGEFVDQIIVRDGVAAGVRTASGATYHAPVVVSTADLKKTYNDLLPTGSAKRSDLRRVNAFRMSHPFFNAFLGVDVDLTRIYPNRDHFSMPTWSTLDDLNDISRLRADDTVDSWLDRVTPVIPAYVHCSDLKDPGNRRYSPPGSSSLEVMFPMEGDHRMWGATPMTTRDHDYAADETYQRVKKSLTDAMIDRATTVLPEIEGRVVHQEAATPLTQERYTQSTQGASYGIEMNTHQMALARPGPKTSIRGLYLAGASCRPGPTTEGVLLSGIYTAGAILGRDLHRDFRNGRYLVPEGTLPSTRSDFDPLAYSRVGARKRTDPDELLSSPAEIRTPAVTDG